MSSIEDQPEFAPITRVCQIIIGALIAGVTWFLVLLVSGIVILNGQAGKQVLPFGPDNWQNWPITSAAIAFALVGFPASFLVPRAMVASSRRGIARGTWPPGSTSAPRSNPTNPATTDSGKLAFLYQTQLIVGAALNEGLTFFALIAYLVERQSAALALAIALILGLASRFPTLGRVESWIESQQDLLLQDRRSEF